MKHSSFDYLSPKPPPGPKMSVLVGLVAGGALLLIVALLLIQVLGR